MMRTRLCAEDHGAELIEFAIASSVLFALIFGVLDFSRALYAYHFCAQMAHGATRYAAVRGATWGGISCSTPATLECAATATDVSNYVLANAPLGIAASNLAITATWPGTTATGASCSATQTTNAPGCLVQVRVQYLFTFALPFLPASGLPLTSSSALSIME